jgi:hypothetical protein
MPSDQDEGPHPGATFLWGSTMPTPHVPTSSGALSRLAAPALLVLATLAAVPAFLNDDAASARDGSHAPALLPSDHDAPVERADREDARAPEDLAGVVRPLDLGLAPVAASSDKKIDNLGKKIDKREQAIAKREEKIAEKEALILELQGELAAAQQALLDAEAMPEGTNEEQKAKNKALKLALKAIKKLEKKIARAEKRIEKLQGSILKIEDKILVLEDKIEHIEDAQPGELPDIGDLGIDGLSLPHRLDLVTLGEDGETVAETVSTGLGGGASPVDSFDPGADYFTDKVFDHVFDEATLSMEKVNSILCVMQQTAHDQMVNKGAYIAQIDEAACGIEMEDPSGNGGQSEDEAEQFQLWTVDSRRTTTDSHHAVGVWVPQEGFQDEHGPGMPDNTIHLLIEVHEEESDSNPYGIFEMDFAGLLDEDPDPDKPLFWGALDTAEAADGFMGFQFYEEAGNKKDQNSFYELTEVHVNMEVDGTMGVARIRDTFREFPHEGGGPGGPGDGPGEGDGDGPPPPPPPGSGAPGDDKPEIVTTEYLLAFDEEHMLRKVVGGAETCLSRTEFSTDVWRYSLYHADGENAGQLVERDSGIPVHDAAGNFGWAGYHGLWFEHDQIPSHGQVVYANVFESEGDPDEYTVFEAPGKLWEYTRNELDIAGLDGQPFEWFAFDPGAPPGSPPPIYQLIYEHLSGDFILMAVKEGEYFTELPPEDQLPVNRLLHPWLDMWSQSLGGKVSHLDGDDHVVFFEERIVDANHELLAGGDLTLYGFFDQLDTDISEEEAEAGDVFLPESHDIAQPYVFQFRGDDLGLHLDTFSNGTSFDLVGLVDGAVVDEGPFSWGMRSGPMVADLDGLTDPFELFEMDVHYVYETGPNPWNVLVALQDEFDDFLSFEPPLQFTYVHSLANDRNGDPTHDGATFQFEYGGKGDLHGIPHDPVDLDGDGFPERFTPAFSLADGVVMGPEGDEYVVKAIDMERSLAEHPGGCDALTTDPVATLPLPDGDTFGFPAIGDMPEVLDPPAVIAGEVQDAD